MVPTCFGQNRKGLRFLAGGRIFLGKRRAKHRGLQFPVKIRQTRQCLEGFASTCLSFLCLECKSSFNLRTDRRLLFSSFLIFSCILYHFCDFALLVPRDSRMVPPSCSSCI
jgi:hypothetical protein